MKKVLLATDGSHNSREAARLLARLSCSEALDLIVVTVLQVPYSVRRVGTTKQHEELIAAETAAAETSFEEIEQILDNTGSKLRHVMREGHCGKEICDLAAAEKAELIVTGAKGRSMIQRTLLGSTSDYVAHQLHAVFSWPARLKPEMRRLISESQLVIRIRKQPNMLWRNSDWRVGKSKAMYSLCP